MAMGEEDERGIGLCDSARSATARTKRSWESRELGIGDTDKAWDRDEGLGPGPAQQNLGPKAKILYGAFLYININ